MCEFGVDALCNNLVCMLYDEKVHSQGHFDGFYDVLLDDVFLCVMHCACLVLE